MEQESPHIYKATYKPPTKGVAGLITYGIGGRTKNFVNPSSLTALNPLTTFTLREPSFESAGGTSPNVVRSLSRGSKRSTLRLKPLPEQQKNVLWLKPDTIDPNFGVQGKSQDRFIRRTFRRLETSALFVPAKGKNIDLGELDKVDFQHKRFVLVEESRLHELSKYEDILREERDLLGKQCTWILSDGESVLNPRIPIPATR